jgi:hypothetical protein
MNSIKSILNMEEGRSTTKAGAGLDKLWLGTNNQPNLDNNSNNNNSSSSSISSWFNLTNNNNSNNDNSANSNPDISANNTKSWFSFENPLSSSNNTSSSNNECLSLNWYQRMGLFSMSFIGGIIMLIMAFMSIPAFLLGSASKFAMSYCLGNILLILSSVFLVGPKAQLQSMLHNSRTGVTIVYLLSLLAVLYCSYAVRSIFVIVPLLIVQFVSLISYVLSYFPYGAAMVKRITTFFARKIGLPI